MMDIAKSETFKNFIILNKALLFLIKLFHYGFTQKKFKQKRPECPFKFFQFFFTFKSKKNL